MLVVINRERNVTDSIVPKWRQSLEIQGTEQLVAGKGAPVSLSLVSNWSILHIQLLKALMWASCAVALLGCACTLQLPVQSDVGIFQLVLFCFSFSRVFPRGMQILCWYGVYHMHIFDIIPFSKKAARNLCVQWHCQCLGNGRWYEFCNVEAWASCCRGLSGTRRNWNFLLDCCCSGF